MDQAVMVINGLIATTMLVVVAAELDLISIHQPIPVLVALVVVAPEVINTIQSVQLLEQMEQVVAVAQVVANKLVRQAAMELLLLKFQPVNTQAQSLDHLL
jgi:hypothetical protein